MYTHLCSLPVSFVVPRLCWRRLMLKKNISRTRLGTLKTVKFCFLGMKPWICPLYDMCRKCVVLLFIFSTAQGFAICRCEGGVHPGVDPSSGVPRLSLLAVCVANASPDSVVVIGLSAKNHGRHGHLPIEMIIFCPPHVFFG